VSHHPLDKLDAYIDGQLPPSQMRRVAQHLTTCRSCRIELERARRLRNRLTRTLSSMPSAPASVVSIGAREVPIWRRYAWAGAAAAVILLAVAARFTAPVLFQAAPAEPARPEPVTITERGDVYVGHEKLPPELAQPVVATLKPERWPHITETAPEAAAGPVRLLHPDPADVAVPAPPIVLAWSGPLHSSYVVTMEERTPLGWKPHAGFPRTVHGLSTSVSSCVAGRTYRWRVHLEGGVATTGWAEIRVLDERARSLLRVARQEYGPNSVVFGAVCASQGLFSQAERALSYQLGLQPDDPALRRAVAALRARLRE
jgi:hypothetical protein